ncbi:MAG TPA: hypothetical protein VHC70_04360 [Phycisphaerales bacterium]|nr:hypothetical protein [Phycisphaerales bacterium]
MMMRREMARQAFATRVPPGDAAKLIALMVVFGAGMLLIQWLATWSEHNWLTIVELPWMAVWWLASYRILRRSVLADASPRMSPIPLGR